MYDNRERRLYDRLQINDVYGELMDGDEEVLCRIDNISENGICLVLEEALKRYPHQETYYFAFYDEDINIVKKEDFYTVIKLNVVRKIGNKIGCKVESNLQNYEDYVMKKKVLEYIKNNRGERTKSAV